MITLTTGYTPESNGLAEQTHGPVLAMARTCLFETKLPLQYYNYAIQHVTDCKNVVPHTVTGRSYEY